jgi:hypothetical protein
MSIEQIADELIAIKTQLDQIESAYKSKRDEMFNRLGAQQSSNYEHGGYRFQKTAQVTVLSVNKQSFIDSLFNADLSEQVRQQIISNALSESIRESGIRITKINA